MCPVNRAGATTTFGSGIFRTSIHSSPEKQSNIKYLGYLPRYVTSVNEAGMGGHDNALCSPVGIHERGWFLLGAAGHPLRLPAKKRELIISTPPPNSL